MMKLKVSIEAKHASVLPGEQLWVEAQVENADVEPVEIPEFPSQTPSPFRYELRNDKNEVLYAVSQEDYRTAIAGGDIIDSAPPAKVTLDPSKSMSITEDISGYASVAFAPGQYRLMAFFRIERQEFASEPVILFVVRPQISATALEYCPAGAVFASVFANNGLEGKVTLYERQTHTANPENGVFQRRIELTGKVPVDALSFACQTHWETEGRWFAWLQGNVVGAAKSWGIALTAQPQPVTIGLSNAIFASPGFQLKDETGLFPVVGIGEGGAAVQFIVADYEQMRVLPPAPLCALRPARIIARFDASDSDKPIALIWGETIAGQSRLVARSFATAGQSLDAEARQIYSRTSPLLALETTPFLESAEGDTGLIHALFGPEKPDAEDIDRDQLVYITLNLSMPDRALSVRRIAVPDDPFDLALIAAPAGENCPIMLRSRGRLLWNASGSNGWNLLRDRCEKAERVRLFATGKEFWLEWVEPGIGVMSQRIPVQGNR